MNKNVKIARILGAALSAILIALAFLPWVQVNVDYVARFRARDAISSLESQPNLETIIETTLNTLAETTLEAFPDADVDFAVVDIDFSTDKIIDETIAHALQNYRNINTSITVDAAYRANQAIEALEELPSINDIITISINALDEVLAEAALELDVAQIGNPFIVAQRNQIINDAIAYADQGLTMGYSPINLIFEISDTSFTYHQRYIWVGVVLLLPLLAIILLLIPKMVFKPVSYIVILNAIALGLFNLFFVFNSAFRRYTGAQTAAWPGTPWFWVAICVLLALLVVVFYGMKKNGEIKPVENVSPPYKRIQKMTITAIMLGLAVVVARLTMTFPLMGIPSLRVSVNGVFHNVTAILLGPFYGGMQRSMSDIINHLISPQGAFLWPITLTAFLRGSLIAFLWIKLKNVKVKPFSIVYTTIFGFMLIFGGINWIALNFFPDAAYVNFLMPILPNVDDASIVTIILSTGFFFAGLIGLVPQIIAHRVSEIKNNEKLYIHFIKLLIIIGVPSILTNSINSAVIFVSFIGPLTREAGFFYYWLPRFFLELATVMFNVFVMVVFLGIYERAMKRKLV
ncbi:MAG: hypothetical protein FWC69_05360 [Defluviitaleaceae bacterium]|nr:hypothetical protein [Defluviitaleaceae bacterium]